MFRISTIKASSGKLRSFSTTTIAKSNLKVSILGASGGIGQPLSLLMKQNDAISELNLYDVVNTPGVSADLSHICTPTKVTGFVGDSQLKDSLVGSQIVVIPAGVPRKPGMTRDDLFNTNASIVKNLATAIAQHCPKAHVLVIANPVNSTVPIVAETFKKAGTYDKSKLFGVTTLDTTRANTFVSDLKKLNVRKTSVSVVGGHSGITIIPLLSQLPNVNFTQQELEALTKRIQFGGDEVVQAKAGAGSATLSMAFAGAHFANRLIEAINGKTGIIECTFVESNIVPGVSFFASPVELGPNGVKTIHGLGKLSEYEQKLLTNATPELTSNIAKGVEFAKK